MLLTDELGQAHALAEQGTLLAQMAFLTGSRDIGTLVTLAGAPVPDNDHPSSEDAK